MKTDMQKLKHSAECLIAALLCVLLISSAGAEAFALTLQDRAGETPAGSSPYLITVNTRENVVTVYGVGSDGFYSVPVRSMICSCGKSSSATPHGTFSIYGERYEWRRMVDGSYGQYAVRFNGSILFHSVCYYAADPSRLMSYEYDMLGSNASLGCVRLQVADARWIYDNCPAGTTVRVSAEDGEGPLGKPGRLVNAVSGTENEGWDPTDPREENPWRATLGDGPYTGGAAGYGNSDGAAGSGNSDGAAVSGHSPSASNGSSPGGALPFPDVRPDDWFYGSVRWCFENGVLKGTGAGFEPHAKVSHAMLWQMIYQLAGEPELSTSADAISNDAAGAAPAQPWYAVARSWCLDAGIISSSGSRDPDAPAQRQEFVHALYRSHLLLRDANPEACADLDAFSDASDMDSRAAAAFRWAVGSGIIEGDIDVEGGRILRLGSELSRAELAAILYRYGAL